MTSRHPELATEQQYLDKTHDAHEATLAHHKDIVAGKHNGGANPAAQRVIRERSISELERLQQVDTSRLIFGRLDFYAPSGTIGHGWLMKRPPRQ